MKKSIAIGIVGTLIISSIASYKTVKAEENTNGIEIIKEHNINIDNREVIIEEVMNNGVKGYLVRAEKIEKNSLTDEQDTLIESRSIVLEENIDNNVSFEEKIEEEIEKIRKENNEVKEVDDTPQIQPRAAIFYEHTSNDEAMGYGSNTNAWVESYVTGVFERPGNFDLRLTISGSQHGHLSGYDPAYASRMVFSQTTDIQGAALSISWPIAVQDSSTTQTWRSSDITSTDLYCYTSDRAGIYATSWSAIFGASITDRVEIYTSRGLYIPTSYLSVE